MNIIYKHTSKTEGLSYIGKSKHSMEFRWRQHITEAKNDSEREFMQAIKRLGANDFINEVLENNIPDENVYDREEYWITYFNTYHNGYNMSQGGGGIHQHTDATLKKISENTKAGMTEEVKQKISDANKNTVSAKDKNGNVIRISKAEFDMLEDIHGQTKGLVTVRNIETNETLSVTQEEMKNNPKLVGVTKGIKYSEAGKEGHKKAGEKRKGSNNPSAVKVNIYNNEDVLLYECAGNIVEVCATNKLPLNLLRTTYQKSTTIQSKKFKEFNGWYARRA